MAVEGAAGLGAVLVVAGLVEVLQVRLQQDGHHRRGRKVLLEVARVVSSPPVLLLAHQLPLEG